METKTSSFEYQRLRGMLQQGFYQKDGCRPLKICAERERVSYRNFDRCSSPPQNASVHDTDNEKLESRE